MRLVVLFLATCAYAGVMLPVPGPEDVELFNKVEEARLLVQAKLDNATGTDRWQELAAALDAFFLIPNMVVTVGSRRQNSLFHYTKGQPSLDTPMLAWSASKWVSAAVIVNSLRPPMLTLDTPVGEILTYWTRDPADPRSRITIRHLLSFTAGFTLEGWIPFCVDLQSCVRSLYGSLRHNGREPGDRFGYFEGTFFDMQVAAAMVEVVHGRRFSVIAEELFQRHGMRHTRFQSQGNPQLAAGLDTTPRDYDLFLRLYASDVFVTAAQRADIERNAFPDAGRDLIGSIVGHYGLGNWYECPLSGLFSNGMTPECAAKREHGSAGLQGWWPGHDARLGFYYQFAQQQETVTSFLARIMFKPLMDSIVQANETSASAFRWPRVHAFTLEEITLARAAQREMSLERHPITYILAENEQERTRLASSVSSA